MTATPVGTVQARNLAAGAAVAIPCPAGLLEGEIVLAHFTRTANSLTVSDPGGLTIVGQRSATATGSHGAAILGKVASAADALAQGTEAYWTATTALTGQGRLIVFRVTGHKGTIADVAGFVAEEWAAQTTGGLAPSVLPDEADALALWISYANADVGNTTWASPAVEFYDSEDTNFFGARAVGVASEAQASAVATGTRDLGFNAVSAPGHCVGVFVRSASVADTTPPAARNDLVLISVTTTGD